VDADHLEGNIRMDTDDRATELDVDENWDESEEAALTGEPAEEDLDQQAPEDDQPPGPKAAPSVRPSFLSRILDTISAPFGRIHLPKWDLRLFGWVLLALVVLAFFVMNWAPMRLFFFGLSVDIPRALAIVILIGIGFLAGWLSRSPSPELDEDDLDEDDGESEAE
jgi:hypothetical protein